MSEPGYLDATAEHLLSSRVSSIDVQIEVFNKMLDGWNIQMTSRYVKEDGRRAAIAIIRRFELFTNAYPWNWRPEDFEAWGVHLIGAEGRVDFSTARQYQGAIRRFIDYITDARYGWLKLCRAKFEAEPVVIYNEFNTLSHTEEFEGRPERRALTYDEVQQFFDAADARVSRARRLKRKGSLAAMRDSAMLKDMYVFGTRCNEHSRLDLPDMRHQPNVPEWDQFGAMHVRYGKAKPGGPPRRRTVLLIPEFQWSVDVQRQYIEEIRPLFDPKEHPAIWITERLSRVSKKYIEDVFSEIISDAGLDPILVPHCLRHSFCTHHLEFGYPPIFVQRQMGHSWASNTGIYGHVSNEYMNDQLDDALDRRFDGKR